MQLENIHTSRVVAFGKYQMDYDEHCFVIKTHIPGETFENILEEIGQEAPGSVARFTSDKEFFKACFNGGKGYGEFHSKGISVVEFSKIEEKLKNYLIEQTLLSKTTNALLNDLQISNKIVEVSIDINTLHHGSLPKEVELCYELMDVAPIWSKSNSSFGLVDTQFIPYTMDLLKKPLHLPAFEYHSFLADLELQGITKGVSLEEIGQFKKAFKKGHFSEFPRQLAYDQFFDIYHSTQTIYLLVEEFGVNIDKNILKILVDRLNNKIANFPI